MTPSAAAEQSVRSSLVRKRASSLGTSKPSHASQARHRTSRARDGSEGDSLDQMNDFHVLCDCLSACTTARSPQCGGSFAAYSSGDAFSSGVRTEGVDMVRGFAEGLVAGMGR
jgi:hypothetical protein